MLVLDIPKKYCLYTICYTMSFLKATVICSVGAHLLHSCWMRTDAYMHVLSVCMHSGSITGNLETNAMIEKCTQCIVEDLTNQW